MDRMIVMLKAQSLAPATDPVYLEGLLTMVKEVGIVRLSIP